MDDDYEIIDEDLDYVLLFDEDKQKEQKNGAGCCFVLFLLSSITTIGFVSLTKVFA